MTGAVVTVTAPSRLHFGLLSFGHNRSDAADAPQDFRDVRQFGGVGMMIDAPAWRLSAEPAPQWRAHGPQADRAGEFAGRFCRSLGFESLPPLQLTVEAAPPAHSGLGSGTQLGLAVATALEAALDLPTVEIAELARRVGRGQRSAIGVHGFLRGGLLVEAGKLRSEEISPLVARAALPEQWRVLLLRPLTEEGLSGVAERAAFAALPPVPAEVTARLCDETLRCILPAARDGDFARFSQAVYRYGHLAGSCFAAVQQGRAFASATVAMLVERLRQQGIEGVGQSSWGPTVFALCRSADEAQRLASSLADPQLETTIAAPCNHGAQVMIHTANRRSDSAMHPHHVVP